MTFTITELSPGRYRVTCIESPELTWVTYGAENDVRRYLADHEEAFRRKLRTLPWREDEMPRRRGETWRRRAAEEVRAARKGAA